jgi:hypothetical protein
MPFSPAHVDNPCRVHRRVLGDGRCGLPRQHWQSGGAGNCGSRPSHVSQGYRAAACGSGPAGRALRRQGRTVARAAGPRHHRPRLRHEAHRGGLASAVSRRRKARARVVTTVRQSAQPPADRSAQRLIPRRRCTAPAHCGAAGSRSAPHRLGNACTDAAPCLPGRLPRDTSSQHRHRCALPVPLVPVIPNPPRAGVLGIATTPEGQRLCRSCHGSSAVFPPS